MRIRIWILIFTLLRIRNQPFTLMWIRVRIRILLPKMTRIHADPNPHHCRFQRCGGKCWFRIRIPSEKTPTSELRIVEKKLSNFPLKYKKNLKQLYLSVVFTLLCKKNHVQAYRYSVICSCLISEIMLCIRMAPDPKQWTLSNYMAVYIMLLST